MSLNKYCYNITNVTHIAIMLNEHDNPTFVYISTKMKPRASDTSHIIAKYVPWNKHVPQNPKYTNMPISSCADIR